MSNRKKKTKKYAPAYYRYKEKHPTISVCLTKDLKDVLDLRKGPRSYAEFIKELIEGNIPQIQEALPIWYLCDVCHKRIPIIPDSREHREVKRYARNHGWGHAECHRRAKEKKEVTILTKPIYKTQRDPHSATPVCTVCNNKANFIEQNNRWYCYNCQKYLYTVQR